MDVRHLSGRAYHQPTADKHCSNCGADLTQPHSVDSLVNASADGIYEYGCKACPAYWKRDGPRWIDHYEKGELGWI